MSKAVLCQTWSLWTSSTRKYFSMYDKVTVWYKFCIHLYEVYACHSLVSARSVGYCGQPSSSTLTLCPSTMSTVHLQKGQQCSSIILPFMPMFCRLLVCKIVVEAITRVLNAGITHHAHLHFLVKSLFV